MDLKTVIKIHFYSVKVNIYCDVTGPRVQNLFTGFSLAVDVCFDLKFLPALTKRNDSKQRAVVTRSDHSFLYFHEPDDSSASEYLKTILFTFFSKSLCSSSLLFLSLPLSRSVSNFLSAFTEVAAIQSVQQEAKTLTQSFFTLAFSLVSFST